MRDARRLLCRPERVALARTCGKTIENQKAALSSHIFSSLFCCACAAHANVPTFQFELMSRAQCKSSEKSLGEFAQLRRQTIILNFRYGNLVFVHLMHGDGGGER